METTVITYNAPSPVARSGAYEYPKPSSRSMSTISKGSGIAQEAVRITLPKNARRAKKA